MSSNNVHFRQKHCAIRTTRDQAAVHRVQIHVGNHFKKQSEETRGALCLSAVCLEFIWKGLIGGSAFVNLNTSNADESRALNCALYA